MLDHRAFTDASYMHGSFGVSLDELSRAQRRLALESGARPGMPAADDDGLVFLYRNDPVATERWLVDREGRVVDVARFRKPVS